MQSATATGGEIPNMMKKRKSFHGSVLSQINKHAIHYDSSYVNVVENGHFSTTTTISRNSNELVLSPINRRPSVNLSELNTNIMSIVDQVDHSDEVSKRLVQQQLLNMVSQFKVGMVANTVLSTGVKSSDDMMTLTPSSPDVMLMTSASSLVTQDKGTFSIAKSEAKKMKREQKKRKDRLFVLDSQGAYFEVWDVRKKHRKVIFFLKDVKEVVSGAAPSSRITRSESFKKSSTTSVTTTSTSRFKKFFKLKSSTTEQSSKSPSVDSTDNFYFTVKYGSGDTDRLKIFCQSKEEFERWVLALNYLIKEAILAYETNPHKILIMKQWMAADANGDGQLSKKEIANLLHALNIDASRRFVNHEFDLADKDKSGYLDYEEFIDFYKKLAHRAEMDDLFNRYTTQFEGQVMLVDEFLWFLQREQHETEATLEDAYSVMLRAGVVQTNMGIGLTKHDFSRYIFGLSNTIVEQDAYAENHDMDQPLSHYYIASSHNTYLTGHQLHGESSVDMYRRVLYTGCRCVELDCWDGKDGEPIIFHGHTLTSKIRFKDVIHCVAQHAFVSSEYPVILSLEMHCSIPQQDKIAQYLIEILGPMLVLPTEVESNSELPSPAKLRKRILIKGKRIRSTSGQTDTDNFDDDDEDLDSVVDDELDISDEQEVRDYKKMKKSHVQVKVSENLSNITALSAVSFKPPLIHDECHRMHSFSETRIARFEKKPFDYMALTRYNTTQLSRVYPKGTRFGSSNYDPLPAWNAGCQLVALNYQTNCRFLRFNLNKFAENGNTGYLLKPSFLRDPTRIFDIESMNHPSYHFKITVVSGETLPKPMQSSKGEVVDPFVRLQLYGTTRDSSVLFDTKTIWDNGFNPVWNETCQFDVFCLDLAHLRVAVYDKNKASSDIFLCETIVSLNELREGYRNVPLRNQFGKLIDGASVLLHIQYRRILADESF